MKSKLFLALTLVCLTFMIRTPSLAQTASEEVKKEISETLKIWNEAGRNRKTEAFRTLFDDTPDIMLIGSDKGEISKGWDEISKWLDAIFAHNSFSWEMDRIDIDSNDKTAWVFVAGRMVVVSDKGSVKKVPYRFCGILVKKDNQWKWRMWDGSSPAGK
jgi:hypothetical protein